MNFDRLFSVGSAIDELIEKAIGPSPDDDDSFDDYDQYETKCDEWHDKKAKWLGQHGLDDDFYSYDYEVDQETLAGCCAFDYYSGRYDNSELVVWFQLCKILSAVEEDDWRPAFMYVTDREAAMKDLLDVCPYATCVASVKSHQGDYKVHTYVIGAWDAN